MDQQQQEGDQQQQQQGVAPVQPQPGVVPKCPRCDSMNTKFCYYNNYSLSQPRYFCKTCRRYWTHGGTLRNVPVGGGCRKGKRPKISSSESPQKLVAQNHLTPTATFYQGGGSGIGGVGTAGGYFASLAGLNNLNHHPPTNYPFDQSLINVGAGVGGIGCSNLGLLQGFNAAAFLGSSSTSSSQRQNPQQQFYQLGNGGMELLSLYNNSEQGLNNIPSTMANNNTNNNYTASAASMLQTQSFMNGAAANSNSIRALSDASLWSTISTTYINGGNNSASDNRTSTAASGAGAGVSAADYASASASAAGGSNSRVPNQWFDLQRFQPPPQ